MARKKPTKKPTSRTAARSAAQKKSPARKTAAKSAARKHIKAKDRRKDRKTDRKTKAGGLPAAKPRARPKQRIAISHYRDEDFKADGLRAYAHYRDLGIAEASHGLAQAHVIRLIGPCNPAEVSKLHFHDVEFQMVYVLKGWVKTYMEGQGETLMKEGSAWTQPPRIKHLIMDYSDDVELLEVILPAEFKTVELAS
ncbi:MAG TPA: cupin domain-containing protein [Bradyrhizobium sp.]|nr:cupin domain-containing protein [Bradyrhizobium sp.]